MSFVVLEPLLDNVRGQSLGALAHSNDGIAVSSGGYTPYAPALPPSYPLP